MLEILKDPSDPEHEEMKIWAGADYDPEQFNPHAVSFDKPSSDGKTRSWMINTH